MNRSHLLAAGLGVAALALITSRQWDGARPLVSVQPSPSRSAEPTGVPESHLDEQLETEKLTSGDDMRIAVSKVAISESANGSRVWGHVCDALDRPVAGVSVGLWPRHDPAPKTKRTFRENEALSRSATTDGGGRYEMMSILLGEYRIYQEGGAGHGNGNAQSITVDADMEYDFRLFGFLDLAGRVVRVHPGPVQLQLYRGRTSHYGSLHFATVSLRSASVRDDGQFIFSGLGPGTYRIGVSGSSHAQAHFDFELGASIHDAYLVLQPGLRFSGQVEAGFKTQRNGISITLLGAGADHSRDSWHADGHFDYSDLLPGSYEMCVGAVAMGRSSNWRSRTLTLLLEEDLTDFRFRLEDAVRFGLTVSLPRGAATTEGLLSARSGAAHEEVKVRLDTESGMLKHQTWDSDGYIQTWDSAGALHMKLQPGTWDVRLDLLGYQPWLRIIVLAEEDQQDAILEPVTGRILEAEYSSRYYRVEIRPTASPEGWQLLLWRDGRVPGQHMTVPEVKSAFLAPGTYDFRIASNDGVGRIFERIKVQPSRERFRVNFMLSTGAIIRGTLEHRDGSNAVGAFYLHQHHAGSWSYLEAKTCVRTGGEFEFRGLGPGRYRGTLDRGGKSIVAEWRVDGKDIDDQRVIAWPLALR